MFFGYISYLGDSVFVLNFALKINFLYFIASITLNRFITCILHESDYVLNIKPTKCNTFH